MKNSTPTLDYLLKSAWHSVANKYNSIASQYGFTQAAGYILINIHKEGTTVSAIANSTGVKTTSLSRILNNLESLGFIYREACKMDKRSVRVYLTELGIEKRKIAKAVVRDFNTFLNDSLQEEEREQFVRVMSKINDLANKYEVDVK